MTNPLVHRGPFLAPCAAFLRLGMVAGAVAGAEGRGLDGVASCGLFKVVCWPFLEPRLESLLIMFLNMTENPKVSYESVIIRCRTDEGQDPMAFALQWQLGRQPKHRGNASPSLAGCPRTALSCTFLPLQCTRLTISLRNQDSKSSVEVSFRTCGASGANGRDVQAADPQVCSLVKHGDKDDNGNAHETKWRLTCWWPDLVCNWHS